MKRQYFLGPGLLFQRRFALKIYLAIFQEILYAAALMSLSICPMTRGQIACPRKINTFQWLFLDPWKISAPWFARHHPVKLPLSIQSVRLRRKLPLLLKHGLM
jgi:hypothetical protein